MDDLMQALEAYVDARCRVAKLETWGSIQAELAGDTGMPEREHPELQEAMKESDELRDKLTIKASKFMRVTLLAASVRVDGMPLGSLDEFEV